MTIRQKIKQLKQEREYIFDTLDWICRQSELLLDDFCNFGANLSKLPTSEQKIREELRKKLNELPARASFFKKRFILEQENYRKNRFLIYFFEKCLNKKSTKNATSLPVKDPAMTNTERSSTRQ